MGGETGPAAEDGALEAAAAAGPTGKKAAGRKALKPVLFAATAVIILAAVAATVIFALRPFPARSAEPAGIEIKGSELVAINADGDELWRYDTGLPNLSAEEYRKRTQYKRLVGTDTYLPFVITRDIDLDGHAEVLFTTQTVGEFNEGGLICFDHRGNEREIGLLGRLSH